jgi:hypothetical protein
MGCFDGVEVRSAAPLSASELSVHVQFDEKDVRCEFKTGSDWLGDTRTRSPSRFPI